MQGGVEVCVPQGGGGADAGSDSAGPDDDLDDDGVPNAMDLCPNKADPMQYDEDGDKVGDACDVCPVWVNNADGDGDGVGDDCDPNPGVGGDKIVAFEGFGGGVPMDWTKTGTWTAAPGAVRVSVAPNVDAILELPFITDARSTVSAAFVSDDDVPDNNSGFGVAHAALNEGVLCGLISEGTRQLALINTRTDSFLDSRQYAWVNQTAYSTGLIRRTNEYACYSADPQGVLRNVEGTTAAVPAQARLQLRSRGISGRFLWVIYVDSP
jgi:hypothetical protein